jgi:hypothetical protein
MSEWIKVKERTPEQAGYFAYSEKVLVQTKRGKIWLAEAHVFQGQFTEWMLVYPGGYCGEDPDEPITHWMPLPAKERIPKRDR